MKRLGFIDNNEKKVEKIKTSEKVLMCRYCRVIGLFWLLFSNIIFAKDLLGNIDQKMRQKGFEIGINSTMEFLRNIHGGIKKKSYFLNRSDFFIGLDGERIFHLPSIGAYVDAMAVFGNNPAQSVGDLQVTSNIDGSKTVTINEAWIQQEFAFGAVSTRAGFYDLNSEFYVTPSSLILCNSSFGIGNEFSQTGQNGPSIFPATGLALRAGFIPLKKTYFQLAVLDGVPGDPDEPIGVHMHLSKEEGVLMVAEGGYYIEDVRLPSKISIGIFSYTTAVPTVKDETVAKRNYGLYLLLDKSLYKSVSIFMRHGWASPYVNTIDFNTAFGVNIGGKLYGRLDDVLAIGVTSVHTTKAYRDVKKLVGISADVFETTIEPVLNTHM